MIAWIASGTHRRKYHTSKNCRHWSDDMRETTVQKAENRWLEKCKRCANETDQNE